MYNDPTIVIVIILAVMAGGLIKGTIGFGMPMVALPLIAFAVPVTTAMILLCAPIFLTNFLQIKFKQGISSYRFFPMFLFLVVGLIIGARLILEINLNTITQIIAILIIFAAVINCFGFKINNNINKKKRKNNYIFHWLWIWDIRRIINCLRTTNVSIFSRSRLTKREICKNSINYVLYRLFSIIWIINLLWICYKTRSYYELVFNNTRIDSPTNRYENKG